MVLKFENLKFKYLIDDMVSNIQFTQNLTYMLIRKHLIQQ